MILIVNGENRDTKDSISLKDLVLELHLEPKHVVLELNARIYNESEWSGIILKENDRLEIIRFMGGG